MACKVTPQDCLSKLVSWSMTSDDREAIKKDFKFSDFKSAFSFMTSIALKAEEMGHHPELFNVYNKITVTLTTHDVDGLSDKDILLGQFIDNEYEK